MTARRGPGFSLAQAARDPGFTPRTRDVGPLLDLLGADEDVAAAAARALVRLPAEAAATAVSRVATAEEPARARLVQLLGLLAVAAEREAGVWGAGAPGGAPLGGVDPIAGLLEGRGDASRRTRRAAATALGKLRAPSAGVTDALARALEREVAAPGVAPAGPDRPAADPSVRRAIAGALGKIGGDRALEALRASASRLDDAGARAVLMAERPRARAAAAAFLAARDARRPTRVRLHARAGLERILAGELEPALGPRVTGEGRVEATLTGAPARLFAARTMLDFGFPLAIAPEAPRRGRAAAAPPDDDLAARIAAAITSEEALELLRHFTEGPIRYRIAWAGGGKRRAVVFRVAEAVRAARPELVNDPSASPWEAVVREEGGAVEVELVPRADDPRFFYRRGDVPAASHPTIAAALVRVGGVRAGDVVWDPFVGSGTELCERALAGPYRRLVGTDRSAAALAVARENLEAAGAREVELHIADAVAYEPSPDRPTLILTNPPMGRRVLRGTDLGALLERFVAHAGRVLAPGGRLAWISPLPARTLAAAERAGLAVTTRQEIDMGGFRAELQLLGARGQKGR